MNSIIKKQNTHVTPVTRQPLTGVYFMIYLPFPNPHNIMHGEERV